MRAFKILSIALVLGAIAVVPGRSAIEQSLGGDRQGGGPVTQGPAGKGPAAQGPKQGNSGPIVTKPGLECTRSRNGSATAPGVTSNGIRLASTVVQSGIGSSFLGDSPTGMVAVKSAINLLGGVCGRLLTPLNLVDDGWDAQQGLRYIKAFIAENYFALPVVPSSEGLTAAIESGEIDKAGIPVVGTDGMLKQQYESPWVWPVATATVSTMRIMAKFGYSKGSRTFAIVYDTRYKFGKEGADAYRAYIKTLPGAKLVADVGIYPGRASYSSEIQRFNSACKNNCDFVAMLLEPQTALTWITGGPDFGTKYTSGAQTLFNRDFATNCGKQCGGMLVWTGYNPPIGSLAGLPDVQQYVRDVRRIDPKVDVTNQFLEGAYLGMKLFVESLKRVGPNLTRANLQSVLNSKCFVSDLASKLCWSTTDRHANKAAQAFSMVVSQGSFSDFADARTGFIRDPAL
jgi:ABC-type branched-subunit amino acid transport system substrate-binding protein